MPLHINTKADYLTINCMLSLSSLTPICHGDIITEKNGPHCHAEIQLSEIFYLETIAASSHVEASCCTATLKNTR